MASSQSGVEHHLQVHGSRLTPLFPFTMDFSQTMLQITSLDDIKSASQNDSNATKSLALDHLGVIAGKLRANSVNWKDSPTCIEPLDDVRIIIALGPTVFYYRTLDSGSCG